MGAEWASGMNNGDVVHRAFSCIFLSPILLSVYACPELQQTLCCLSLDGECFPKFGAVACLGLFRFLVGLGYDS